MDTRQALRQEIRNKRRQLTAQQQSDAAIALLHRFSADERIMQAKHMALYLSNDGELNTTLIIDWCWQQDKCVYLPVVHPFTQGHLLFLRFEPQTALINNRYGIGEPQLDVRAIIPAEQLDIICTPLVAFDKTGARLGMGGGFYDRTLSRWYLQDKMQNISSPYSIGLAHDCQLVDSLPTQQWDIPLSEIITPAAHFKFK